MSDSDKRDDEVDHIDVTPTWSGLLRPLLCVLDTADEEARGEAMDSLIQMARVADLLIQVRPLLRLLFAAADGLTLARAHVGLSRGDGVPHGELGIWDGSEAIGIELSVLLEDPEQIDSILKTTLAAIELTVVESMPGSIVPKYEDVSPLERYFPDTGLSYSDACRQMLDSSDDCLLGDVVRNRLERLATRSLEQEENWESGGTHPPNPWAEEEEVPEVWHVTVGCTAAKEALHGGQLVCHECVPSFRQGGPSGAYVEPAPLASVGESRKCSICHHREAAPVAGEA